MDDNRYLITFKITAMAFKFENYCNKEGIDTKMVPVPSKLSDSCGYACRIFKNQLQEVRKLCKEKNIKYGEIYKITEDNIPKKLKKDEK